VGARLIALPAALALALALAVATAGCGGEDSDSAAAAKKPSLTKKQFARQAHAICYRLSKKQVRQMEAFGKRNGFDLGEPGRREREKVNAAVVLPVVEEKIEALGALPVPKGDEGEVRQILASMEKGIRTTEAHPDWLAAPTARNPNPFAETLELTAAYGIWLCGQP
jgi:hypothetical protein